MNTNKQFIKKYILLNVYLEHLKPGDKILSAKQMSIKFGVALNTIKKELINFKNHNLLITHERKGFYVNPEVYKVLPLSLTKKFDLTRGKFTLIRENDSAFLIKEYSSKEIQSKIWVESRVFTKVFNYSEYLKEKTFMYNLAWNGIVISGFNSKYKIMNINSQKYLVENRALIDVDGILVVEEDIYIPYELWFSEQKFKF